MITKDRTWAGKENHYGGIGVPEKRNYISFPETLERIPASLLVLHLSSLPPINFVHNGSLRKAKQYSLYYEKFLTTNAFSMH